jgi:hypothetical protein
MHRFFGILLVCALVIAAGSSTAFAYTSPQQYGVELRGGFGQYDLGDVSQGATYMRDEHQGNALTTADTGPIGGISLLYRPARHSMWEVGYNAILDVENKVDNTIIDSSGSIVMHANEFFLKANLVPTIGERLSLNLGVGLSYYNVELQIQDDFSKRYNYDAVGRAWGLLGSVGLEYLISDRFGLNLQGGGRIANAANFSYEPTTGVRTGVSVLGGSRPIEVNMSGMYGSVGLRFYFDKVLQPVDFTR